MNSLFDLRWAAQLTCVALFGLPAGWALMAAEHPHAEITNGQLHLVVYLPDANNGFYRGTRFDWSGEIASLEYKGHHYYTPWFNAVDPNVHDYRYAGSEIIASPCSAAAGPVEEFQTNGSALGWDEAKIGGTFVKIGVGVLRKDAPNYDYVKQYEIVDPGKWTVERRHDAIQFVQELTDPSSGYGYVYRKTVRLIDGKPEMVLEHTLRSTGRRAIRSEVYNHNFLVLDQQPPGPDFAISVPFQIQTPHPLDPTLAKIETNQFVYTKALQNEDMVQTLLQGFSDSRRDNEIRVENQKVGAGMRITGDHPLSKLNLWSIRAVLSLEPFISMTIEPGSEFSWKMSYEYYTLPKSAR